MSSLDILTDLALNSNGDDITSEAFAATKKIILDTVGVVWAGYSQPGVSPVLELVREWGGRNDSVIFLDGNRVPASNAALVNSAMAHALDYDDTNKKCHMHVMSCIFPAAFAAAEKANSSGKEFVEALIIGTEVACRIAKLSLKLQLTEDCSKRTLARGGFLPSSVIGGFGAVAAVSRLWGLAEKETANAFGINYCQASGNRQALLDHTLSKRLQPGFAARSAICAVELAQKGFTGPENCISGERGLFRVYFNVEPPADEEFYGRAGFYEIENLSVKKYPSCGACHTCTEVAIDLAKEHDLDPDEIELVELYGPKGGIVGYPWPEESDKNPQVTAQFCASYGVALGLLKRKAGLREYTGDILVENARTVALAKEIEIKGNLPGNKGNLHGVSVRTKDGRVLEKYYDHVELWLPHKTSFDDVVEKFMDCMDFAGASEEKAQEIISSVKRIDSLSNITDFASLCLCR